MLHDAVVPDAGADLLPPGLQRGGERLLPCFPEDGSRALEFDANHGVGGDEEPQDSSIVAGAERASHQPRSIRKGIPHTAETQGLSPDVSLPLERILVPVVPGVVVEGRLGLCL